MQSLNFKKKEKEFWDNHSLNLLIHFYGNISRSYHYKRKAKIIGTLIISSSTHSNSSILNIGCGTCFLLFFHNEIKQFKYFIGIDISFKSLLIAKKIVKNKINREFFEFVCCDCKNLPFKNKSIEYGITIDSLHHIQNPSVALNELNKIVNIILCLEPNYSNPIRKRYEKNTIKHNTIRERSFTFFQMKHIFKINSIKLLKIQGLHFLPYFRKNYPILKAILKVFVYFEKYLEIIFPINRLAGCIVIIGKSMNSK